MGGGRFIVVATLTALVATSLGSAAGAQQGRLVTYEAPAGQKLSSDYVVKVRVPGGEWREVDAYEVTVDLDTRSKAAMVGFDADGPVEVAISKTSGTLKTARVRPLSYGITATVEADRRTATFTLPRPANVSYEPNGDILHNVHVFANPIETRVPRPGKNVIVFGPGKHAIGGDHVLRVRSNTTVYLAGGAYVQGRIAIKNARNVVVRGHGIVDSSAFFKPGDESTIHIERSSDVGIRDLTLLRAQSITIGDSKRITVANVREINPDKWSDGVSVNSSSNVLVDGAFLRTSDDSIAVYATTPWIGHGSTRGVTVRNTTLWADVAHGFMAGVHGNPKAHESVSHIAVQNVDVLEHDEYRGGGLYQGALAINVGDRVTARDIRFEDVRIENFSRGQVVNLKVFMNPDYNKQAGLEIERVLFRNVAYTGHGDAPSIVRGHSKFQQVKDVTFENFVRNGKRVLRPAAGNMDVGPFVSGIVFRRQASTRVVNDTSRALQYAGRWSRRTESGAHRTDVHVPLRPGGRLMYEFGGRQARIYGRTAPNGGRVEVVIDGGQPVEVDTYSPAARAQQIWFDTGVLRPGAHTLEVRYVSKKNALSTGASVGFDKLEIVR